MAIRARELPQLAGKSSGGRSAKALAPRHGSGPSGYPEDDAGGGSAGIPLDEVLLPSLLHRAAQCADWHVERRLARLQLTARQFAVLDAINRSPGLRQTELGVTTGIDRSTIVNIVDRLERRGLVVRNQAPFDRRAVALLLSIEGQHTVAKARPLVEAVHAQLLAGLPEKFRPEIQALLVALIAPGR